MAFINVDIPIFSGFLSPAFMEDKREPYFSDKFVVEVFNASVIPQRCLMFSVMTEMGSQHARVPIHYLYHKEPTKIYPLDWLQLWDSVSPYCTAVKHEYLKNRRCSVLLKDKTMEDGTYMFTIDWIDGPAYQASQAEIAAGHKSLHVIKLENGQFAAQPNNRVVWHDGGAFIGKKLEDHHTWKVFSHEFSCEAMGWKWTAGEQELMYYQFDENRFANEVNEEEV